MFLNVYDLCARKWAKHLAHVITWVLQKQMLRWSFGCKMFIRDQHCERKEEEAGLGRGRRFLRSFQPTWWGILRRVLAIMVPCIRLK